MCNVTYLAPNAHAYIIAEHTSRTAKFEKSERDRGKNCHFTIRSKRYVFYCIHTRNEKK